MQQPEFRVMPPLRCCARSGNSAQLFCAKLAYWRRPAAHTILEQVFCHVHQQPGDEPIAGALMLRRVELRLDVWLHGMGFTTLEAHAEGLQRLEVAVLGLGGLMNLHGVTSEIGRFTLPAVVERRKARFGEG